MSTVAPANSDPETKPTGPEPTERAPADADEEPQNALTEKFTEKEWAALKELRVRAFRFTPHVIYGAPTTDSRSVSSPRYPRKGI